MLVLGLTCAKLGEKGKAREALERAFKIDPHIGEEAKQVLVSISQH